MRNGFVKTFHRRSSVHGLTLVELLVVLGVVSVLTAIILPSVKSVLTDRKSSQSAIVVRNFFEAARARAIGKNRTVAVVLERLSSRAYWDETTKSYRSETVSYSITGPDSNYLPYNACIRLSLAEERLPITQATYQSIKMTPFRNDPALRSNPIPPDGPTDPYFGRDSLFMEYAKDTDVRIIRLRAPNAGDSRLLQLSQDLIAGTEISLGTSKRRFTIVSPRSPKVHQDYLSLSATTDCIWFSVMNQEFYSGLSDQETEGVTGPYEALPEEEFDTWKIYPKPKPIYAETVQLPRGMCIDFSLSGFGGETKRNDISSSKNTRPIIDLPLPPIPPNSKSPLSDYRVRFASDWIANGGEPLTPEKLRPVYISFSPDGNLSHVWANERRYDFTDPKYVGNLTRIDATQDIFLHIGKIDQIVLPVDPAVGGRNKLAYLNASASGVKQNLSDLNSYVVRLSPKSGAIIASPAVSIDTQIGILGLDPATLSLGDLIELSRRGTYSTNVTAQ